MKLIKKGKTKDVYDLENGNFLLQLKDTTTVDEDGKWLQPLELDRYFA